jgi:hypothetical protein
MNDFLLGVYRFLLGIARGGSPGNGGAVSHREPTAASSARLRVAWRDRRFGRRARHLRVGRRPRGARAGRRQSRGDVHLRRRPLQRGSGARRGGFYRSLSRALLRLSISLNLASLTCVSLLRLSRSFSRYLSLSLPRPAASSTRLTGSMLLLLHRQRGGRGGARSGPRAAHAAACARSRSTQGTSSCSACGDPTAATATGQYCWTGASAR